MEGHPEPLFQLALQVLPVEGHPEPRLVLHLAVHVFPLRQVVLQVMFLGRGVPRMDLVQVCQVLFQAQVRVFQMG